ncbi:NADPH-dependent oxidoreductase [Enterococcus dongliensis]|uniref:NADPH-dependent oxidoreductase n=1 Tax=Enterococcus dongliensis TaxID=2559925 RepID=A0AAW8TRI8_9ENTE|nr:NADPH-dependent oxidoreductase [Enterococcus dongliensis]MDT2604047.1 NADPH-dependent oxidoreductase [Enterococcus dongliensis]MDT2635602.1 NADPH-dependent oxidoreductase [Enterococcus dongliensis]MDT2638298.1 NADPH-dependent oxidoreductase [Enterococcus dongliensis]MDT2643422.1 NADPH-dependent oxidoreductase [Enterococcus dongliensis]MDT2645151.1 NADPH-dependent oxidoreductase [Enterococcus dongliensis]
MKLIGIVGSTADKSYNRQLLQFIAKEYYTLFDLEILEIANIPMFNQSKDQTNSVAIQNMARKIMGADGVIIATPEHNHTIPAGLKSVLEWLSFSIHPLENKPVMIVGASYFSQGSSRAQLHLRQILDAPGVNALVMPGNEFLLGNVKEAFDEDGNLKDEGTIGFLGSVLNKFVQFIEVISQLDGAGPKTMPEDLYAKGSIPTTIEGVEMAAEDWVEQASEKVNAVKGDTYVELDRGILTVDQINYFLKSMPLELTFADSNNQFLYYNRNAEAEDMFAKRWPRQVGNALAYCHPEQVHDNVAWVIAQLRSGAQDAVRVRVPTHGPDKFVVHTYQAMHDDEGNYVGINEYILDYQPLVDWYLQQTGQELVAGSGESVDAVSGASKKEADPKPAAPAKKPAAPAKPAADAVSSASKH